MGGVTVYCKKLKVKYYNFYFTDGSSYPGYYIIPPFDHTKFKNIKFNLIYLGSGLKESYLVNIDKYNEALNDQDASISISTIYLSHVTPNDYNHDGLQGTRWAEMFSDQDSIRIQSIQLLN